MAIGVFLALVPLVLIAVFYFEEDRRGAKEWENAQAEVRAQGLTLDPAQSIPSPIPEADNLGNLALFGADEGTSNIVELSTLKAALQPVSSRLHFLTPEKEPKPDSLPFLPKWTEADPPDLKSISARLKTILALVDPGTPVKSHASCTELLDALCPALAELREENKRRPDCLFVQHFEFKNPAKMSFGPTVGFLRLNEVLIYQERLALYENNPQLALANFEVAHKLILGLKKQPFLLSGMVAMALSEMQLVAVQEGLARHAWDDRSLVEIDATLGKLDMLSLGRKWLIGDVVVFQVPAEKYYEQHRFVSLEKLSMLKGDIVTGAPPPVQAERLTFWLTPKGWFDRDLAARVRIRLLELPRAFDPAKHQVHPEKLQSLLQSSAGRKSWVFWSVPLIEEQSWSLKSIRTLAYDQIHLDEARIACRLERYRLVHGDYPENLAALESSYGRNPRDVMTGEPYLYRRTKSGYLLYSVGWNQEDEGGEKVPAPPSVPSDAPDWAWPRRLLAP